MIIIAAAPIMIASKPGFSSRLNSSATVVVTTITVVEVVVLDVVVVVVVVVVLNFYFTFLKNVSPIRFYSVINLVVVVVVVFLGLHKNPPSVFLHRRSLEQSWVPSLHSLISSHSPVRSLNLYPSSRHAQ